MFPDYAELQGLQKVADLLAATSDWPLLYNELQLSKNEVPVFAAVYVEDMYVRFDYSNYTASKIKHCKTFVTNLLYHDALGSKTEDVLKRLFDLREDVSD